jgi:hypothetical protein
MEEELLTTLSRLSNVIGGFVTAVLIPVAGYWGYRNITSARRLLKLKRRKRTISRNMLLNGKSYTKRKNVASANWMLKLIPCMKR